MDIDKPIHPVSAFLFNGAAKLHEILPAPPLAPLQPLLAHVVRDVAKRRPGVFARLGKSARKRFLIDPVNFPFVLVLQPDPFGPRLTAHKRASNQQFDVRIAGKFATLLGLIDGESDSDALFFSRDIVVEGDTEAIVALRNALDDMDSTLAGDVAASFGPLAGPVRKAFDITLAMGSARQ